MANIMQKLKDLAGKHDDQVDKGIDKAGEQIDKRTDSQYTSGIDKGVDEAQRRTGPDAPS
ncbi:MAG: antitoxin [Frankia sp.]